MRRSFASIALILLTACEQITGVKPRPIDCAKPDTLASDVDGVFRLQIKLGCLKAK